MFYPLIHWDKIPNIQDFFHKNQENKNFNKEINEINISIYNQRYINSNFFFCKNNQDALKNLYLKIIEKINNFPVFHHNNKNIYRGMQKPSKILDENLLDFNLLVQDASGLGYLCHWLWSQNITDFSTFFTDDKAIIKIRYRGLYYDLGCCCKNNYHKIINQWKIYQALDLIESKPQTTVIEWEYDQEKFFTRWSLYPLINGEKLSVRILYNKYLNIPWSKYHPTIRDLLINIFQEKTFFIIGGIAGSGKTTLAYGLNQYLAHKGYNLLSIENPVEYISKDFAQSNGGNFNHLMRHDLDYIFMGEILTMEEAKIALNLIATGHGVISTLHINNIEDLNYRWDGVKFYKGYGIFPKIFYYDNDSIIIIEIYDLNKKLLSPSYEDQIAFYSIKNNK